MALSGLIVILVAGMAITVDYESGADKQLLKVGDPFPAMEFEGKLAIPDQYYLGIADSLRFTLQDINANIIFVEFLNKYCVHCQQQAPVLNQLFDEIKRDSLLQSQVKIFGLGMGNNLRQLQLYRNEKQILFPLIPDANFNIHEALGRPKAPFMVIFKKTADGRGIVSATYLGLVTSKDEFLAALTKLVQPEIFVLQEVDTQQVTFHPNIISPVQTEKAFVRLVKNYFKTKGYRISKFERISARNQKNLFKAHLKLNGAKQVIFIREIYRNTVCDVCHDTHFWYGFDRDGTITHFGPIYLPKSYNKEWNEADVRKLSGRLISRSVTESFDFDPEIDAVTSATITSSLIFDTMNKTKYVFNDLKEQRFIK